MMSTICADQLLHRHIEIPPRKQQQLLLRHNNNNGGGGGDEVVLHHHHRKFLPFNNGVDDDDDVDSDSDDDPYASDHFRIYEFKIRRCTRSRSHDWTDCPFAHPGEKARRRDPRRYCYTGTICSDFRRNGACSRGEECEFAHGVFECWLHPSRYRTEACKDGKNCKRKVCFFAHTPHQLRILPEVIITENEKHKHMTSSTNQNHCCVYCHNHLTNSVSNSPTSTLFGLSHLSPPLSPPLSPVSHRSSPVSHRLSKFSNVNSSNFSPNYKDSLTELMTSLEAMNVNHEVSSPISPSFNWVDVNFNNDDQQFVLSPSTPARVHQARNLFNNGDYHQYKSSNHKVNYDTNGLLAGSSSPDPYLGWVNDLLK